MADCISMIHGSGGTAMNRLIGEVFVDVFGTDELRAMEDAAVVQGEERLAMTTDSFVVSPLFYPGGDIGRLAVCGTVNDLLMRGAVPKYMTSSFILEEGVDIAELKRIVQSMAAACVEAGVEIVCGDTKVIEGHGGLYINTAGVGFVPEDVNISGTGALPGDKIIVSGTMGDHHAAILGCRMELESEIVSDNAPLVEIADAIRSRGVHSLRDVTRGGLGTVLYELAAASGKEFFIEEEAVPVTAAVRDFASVLGLDPMYMGNEGKLVAIVDSDEAEEVLGIIRTCAYGEHAAVIGEVRAAEKPAVFAKTSIGGRRRVMPLSDEGLPRIC